MCNDLIVVVDRNVYRVRWYTGRGIKPSGGSDDSVPTRLADHHVNTSRLAGGAHYDRIGSGIVEVVDNDCNCASGETFRHLICERGSPTINDDDIAADLRGIAQSCCVGVVRYGINNIAG
jgi:hypothetical protein